MIERHEKFLGHFCPKTNCFPQNLFHHAKILSCFFVVKSWKEKKINSHGMEQAKTMSIVHTWMLTKINNQSWLIHCCVIIWKLVWLLGGYLSISRSNLFTNSCLMSVHFKQFGFVNYAIPTPFHSSLDVSKICNFYYYVLK